MLFRSNLCPHMKRITLEKILHSLQTLTHEITIDPAVADPARRAVEAMVSLGNGPGTNRFATRLS